MSEAHFQMMSAEHIRQVPAGRSGWASFSKVTVTDPPTNEDGKTVSFFVKSSGRSNAEMFEGESLGLEAMYACSAAGDGGDSLRIPKVYKSADFASGNGSFLIMEYLNLAGRSDDQALGKAMARMHLAEANEESGNANKAFGFPLDNTIGGTPQPNPWTAPWTAEGDPHQYFLGIPSLAGRPNSTSQYQPGPDALLFQVHHTRRTKPRQMKAC